MRSLIFRASTKILSWRFDQYFAEDMLEGVVLPGSLLMELRHVQRCFWQFLLSRRTCPAFLARYAMLEGLCCALLASL